MDYFSSAILVSPITGAEGSVEAVPFVLSDCLLEMKYFVKTTGPLAV